MSATSGSKNVIERVEPQPVTIKCPNCGSTGPFDVQGWHLTYHTFTTGKDEPDSWYETKNDETPDCGVYADAKCTCYECDHEALASQFGFEVSTPPSPELETKVAVAIDDLATAVADPGLTLAHLKALVRQLQGFAAEIRGQAVPAGN